MFGNYNNHTEPQLSHHMSAISHENRHKRLEIHGFTVRSDNGVGGLNRSALNRSDNQLEASFDRPGNSERLLSCLHHINSNPTLLFEWKCVCVRACLTLDPFSPCLPSVPAGPMGPWGGQTTPLISLVYSLQLILIIDG